MEENGRRDLGYLEGRIEGMEDSIGRIDVNVARIVTRLDEMASRGHEQRIEELHTRLGAVEARQERFWRDTVGVSTGVAAVVTFFKSLLFGR